MTPRFTSITHTLSFSWLRPIAGAMLAAIRVSSGDSAKSVYKRRSPTVPICLPLRSNQASWLRASCASEE